MNNDAMSWNLRPLFFYETRSFQAKIEVVFGVIGIALMEME